MSPRNVNGFRDNHHRGAPAELPPGAPSKMQAPRTGKRATHPGNGVALENQKEQATIVAKPVQPSSELCRPTYWRPRNVRATREPAANSHTRVGVTKYALALSAFVARTE